MPLPFKLIAAISLAPFHSGAFLWDEFSRDYCAPCRRWLSFLSLVLAVIVLGLAALVVRWALTTPFLSDALIYWKPFFSVD